MIEEKKIHIAMVNSFNVITKRVSVGKVLYSDIPLFAHDFHNGADAETLKAIIAYFEVNEMFERCAELKDLLTKMNGNSIADSGISCQCKFPELKTYSNKTKCAKCKKQLLI